MATRHRPCEKCKFASSLSSSACARRPSASSASRKVPSSTRCSMTSSLTSLGLRTKPEMSGLA
eukprot:scaffold63255_cov60-Phaeocystis_antarctica.AAC.1